MVRLTKVIFTIMRFKASEFIPGLILVAISVIGNITRCMEPETFYGLMARPSKDAIKAI